ncbi:MAG TPA: hypothetical protein VN773_09980 [Verrucomicrobiae bacterium]|nr:hypothetical protein [Verrucomicrobiae bacterium]
MRADLYRRFAVMECEARAAGRIVRRWRVSQDVADELRPLVTVNGQRLDGVRLISLIVNGRETITDRVLGYPLEADDELPPRSIMLEGDR